MLHSSMYGDSRDGGWMDEKPWTDQTYWEERFRQADTPWDIGMPSPVLVELERVLRIPARARVIIPGCGLGSDALYFARKGYQVSAVDWSQTAVEKLRLRGKKEELELEVLASDFWEIPRAWYQTFDVFAEHTFFCAIDPGERRIYVEQVERLLRPRGHLLASFFVTHELPGKSYSINPEHEGPPFWTTEKDILELFENHFEIHRFEPSPFVHPRANVREWWAHFTRKR